MAEEVHTATVTDANVVLGRLVPREALGGATAFEIDRAAALRVMQELGAQVDLSAEEAALGVVRVANATMERALRRVSIERGHDPRDYELVPFGGAGPLHACELAELLGISRILLPRYPGVLSALGLLMADRSYDTSTAILSGVAAIDSALHSLEMKLTALEGQIRGVMEDTSNTETIRFEARLDMRYAGQSYEIEVPVNLPISSRTIHDAVHRFHDQHQQRYGYRVERIGG